MGEDTTSIVSRKDVVTTLGAAGANVAAALAINPTTAPGVLALAAVLVAIFPPALAALTEAGARRMKARYDALFQNIVDSWARDENMTPEEVARRLEAAKDDVNVSEAVWRAVRALFDATSDAAAIPLGVLTAEYAKEKRPADAFFRGVVRLLQELESRELIELRDLLRWVKTTTARAEVKLVARWEGIDVALDEFAKDTDGDGKREKRSCTSIVTDPERFFALLTWNGLALSHPGMRMGGGVPEITLRRPTVEKLLRLLSMG